MSNVVRLSDVIAGFGKALLDAQRVADGAARPSTDLPMETAATDPMRVMNRLRCDECGHDWQQPAAAGLCPRCHSTDVRCEERRVCVNKRV
jgi:rubrerythrin